MPSASYPQEQEPLPGLGSEAEDLLGHDEGTTALLGLDVESGALSGVDSGTASIEATGEASGLGIASAAMTREAVCFSGTPQTIQDRQDKVD